VQKRLDRVNTVVQENVTGARVVKAYVCEDYEFDRFSGANGALRSVNYRVLRLMAVIPPILTVVQNLSVIAVILIGGNRIQANLDGMTVGTVMAAVTYVTQVVSSIMMVTMVFQSISRAAASAKRVNEVLETEPVIRSGEKSASSTPVAISMKNVSFRYPGTKGEPVLRDINLEIRRGETLAVVGATGCGKTTLASLIPRFYDATEGEVRVDGLAISDYDLSALRQKIGFVMQKSELFSDTVSGNLRWGKQDATEEELHDAARAAQAYDFVSSMPEGFESFIAEKGASLSGGQKQRLSIARALVRRPEILILDDSTSALDLATEAKLRAALRERLTDTTVVLIAQRIASVKHADRIAVMENGTVVACDTHESLMQSCPTYIEICQSQLRANDAEGGGAR
jgi:ATP-binding cassette subfamily B protein